MKTALPLLIVVLSAPPIAAADPAPHFAKAGAAFLAKHCLDCHGADDPEAGLSLTGSKENSSLIPKRDKWDAILRMVETGVMPPLDAEQPSPQERKEFVALVRAILQYGGSARRGGDLFGSKKGMFKKMGTSLSRGIKGVENV